MIFPCILRYSVSVASNVLFAILLDNLCGVLKGDKRLLADSCAQAEELLVHACSPT